MRFVSHAARSRIYVANVIAQNDVEVVAAPASESPLYKSYVKPAAKKDRNKVVGHSQCLKMLADSLKRPSRNSSGPIR